MLCIASKGRFITRLESTPFAKKGQFTFPLLVNANGEKWPQGIRRSGIACKGVIGWGGADKNVYPLFF